MLDRTIAPAIKEIETFQLTPAEVSILPNGARLHCLKNNQQPVIKLEIVFKAGKWYEPAKGVSYLTAKMLLEGTTKHTARQIADIIALHGASLECNQGFDRTSITLYCLTKHFNILLPLIKEIITEVSFPEDEFELLKQRTIQNTTIEKQKNSYLATVLLTKNIYGASHPYVTGLDEDNITNVSLSSLRDFYESSFTISETEIFLAGAVSTYEVDLISKYIGFITDKILIRTQKAETNTEEGEKNIFFSREDKLQTSIRIGTSFPLMTHPNYPKIFLLNKILGGYFGSRLMKNIREEKGYTYGIHSTLSPKEHSTLFYIGTDVNYKNTEQTIEEIFKEIEKLKIELVNDDELNNVKNYTIGKFLNETTSIFDQVDKYKLQITQNLNTNFFSSYINSIKNTTPEEICNLSQEYLAHDKLTVISVGKKSL